MPCSIEGLLLGGAWSQGGICSLGGGGFHYGLLFWSFVMAFWFGGLLIEGSLLVWSSGDAFLFNLVFFQSGRDYQLWMKNITFQLNFSYLNI